MVYNVFRILGDVSHTTSKLILIWAIHSNSSAEGVSLITQVLYALVFCTRYLDIFRMSVGKNWEHMWNFSLKIFYIASSFYIIFLMTSVYARTREREKAWKFGLYCLLGSVLIAPFWYLIFREFTRGTGFLEILWTFSEILESVCVLPQLLLLRQTAVPTVLDSFYLVALGTYRFMYVLNWIVRGATETPPHIDPTSWFWGTVQTALMIDFAWVYWTRQRVKLRHGGIVDSDDMRGGWLVGRFVGRKSLDFDAEDEEAATGAGGRTLGGNANANARNKNNNNNTNNGWGRRGISVSADEGVLEGESTGPAIRKKSPVGAKGQGKNTLDPEAQPLADPAAFEDESDDEGAPAAAGSSSSDAHPSAGHDSGVSGGDEWNDDLDEDARERK